MDCGEVGVERDGRTGVTEGREGDRVGGLEGWERIRGGRSRSEEEESAGKRVVVRR